MRRMPANLVPTRRAVILSALAAACAPKPNAYCPSGVEGDDVVYSECYVFVVAVDEYGVPSITLLSGDKTTSYDEFESAVEEVQDSDPAANVQVLLIDESTEVPEEGSGAGDTGSASAKAAYTIKYAGYVITFDAGIYAGTPAECMVDGAPTLKVRVNTESGLHLFDLKIQATQDGDGDWCVSMYESVTAFCYMNNLCMPFEDAKRAIRESVENLVSEVVSFFEAEWVQRSLTFIGYVLAAVIAIVAARVMPRMPTLNSTVPII